MQEGNLNSRILWKKDQMKRKIIFESRSEILAFIGKKNPLSLTYKRSMQD